MKKISAILVLFLLSSLAFGQLTQGALAIGGVMEDDGFSMVQTYDKGYAIAGYTLSYGDTNNGDMYVVKLDATGNLKWTRTIGGAASDEWGQSIVQTYDKGLVVAGYTGSYGAGSYDVYVAKLDSAGNLKWTKTIGGPLDDEGYSVIQTSDRGLVIVGFENSYGPGGYKTYVVKLDSAGNLKWTKTIGGISNDYGYRIIETSDKGFAIAGITQSFGAGGSDMYVIRLDSVGNLIWDRSIGGASDDYAWALVQTYDKGFAITGATHSFGSGLADVYVAKLSSTGKLLWTKTIGGANLDEGWDIVQTPNKDLIVTGITYSYADSTGDVYLIKFDSAGNFKWSRTFGGTQTDWLYSIVQTTDKGMAFGGFTASYGQGSSDVYFVKMDSLENMCQPYLSDSGKISTGGTIDSGSTISTGGVTGSGAVVSNGGILTNICSVLTRVSSVDNPMGATLFPNPSHGKFTIQLHAEKLSDKTIVEIYNMLGEKVYSSQYPILNSIYQINISSQPAGIYMYRMISEKGEVLNTGKFIIE